MKIKLATLRNARSQGYQYVFHYDEYNRAPCLQLRRRRRLVRVGYCQIQCLDKWHLTYDTPITGDVIGYLTPAEVEDLLAQIEALPVEAAA